MTPKGDGRDEAILFEFARRGVELLQEEDAELYGLLEAEYRRQQGTLALVASCCPAHPSTLACEGSFASNVTAEGYPGARYHAGCEYVDRFERLAIERAKQAFQARYANVQPHSASTANQIVMASLLEPGQGLLGLQLDCGGHLSHGSKVNISGRLYRAFGYGLDRAGYIDYAQVEALAIEHRPRLIICGTTAYPRAIDFVRFREIADRVGAWLLADISHVAGLVIGGEHASPIDVAHVTTTCTHKQLYGPRGGLILMGKDWDAPTDNGASLSERIQRGVFPFLQGAPNVNAIVAKARTLGRATSPEFRLLAGRIVALARALAVALRESGARVMSGGTDTHIVVVDVLTTFSLTGLVAERALQDCGVIVNKNRIAGDTEPMTVTSGIRLGTNSLAVRGFTPAEMRGCADLLTRILQAVRPRGPRDYAFDPGVRERLREEAERLCARFPITGYPQERRGAPPAGTERLLEAEAGPGRASAGPATTCSRG